MTAVLPHSLFEMKRGLCPGCGAPLPIDSDTASTVCRHCGTQAVLERRLRRREPEVPGAPLPLFVDVGGAEIGATGTKTPWVRTKQFRESFVERAVCPGCGEGIEIEGQESLVACVSCGTECHVERRLWAPPPDPANEILRPRRLEESRGDVAEDADPETEHLIWRIVNEKDVVKQIAFAWKMSESWSYANKTSARLLPAMFASMKDADPRYQYAASQVIGKLLCEATPCVSSRS